MLLESRGSFQAMMKRFAPDDFDQRQQHQRGQRQRHEEIFDLPKPAMTAARGAGADWDQGSFGGRSAGHFPAPSFPARNVLRSLMTSSKMSAGTTVPRIKGKDFSTTWSHSAFTSGVRV